jgi:hypothetical protein
MHNILVSAAEAELAALFHNDHDGVPLWTTLIEMGHPQGAPPIQTDNACTAGIANETVKQRCSKAVDIHFYWIHDRIHQGQSLVQSLIHWRRGIGNVTDCFNQTSFAGTSSLESLAILATNCAQHLIFKHKALVRYEGVLVRISLPARGYT